MGMTILAEASAPNKNSVTLKAIITMTTYNKLSLSLRCMLVAVAFGLIVIGTYETVILGKHALKAALGSGLTGRRSDAGGVRPGSPGRHAAGGPKVQDTDPSVAAGPNVGEQPLTAGGDLPRPPGNPADVGPPHVGTGDETEAAMTATDLPHEAQTSRPGTTASAVPEAPVASYAAMRGELMQVIPGFDESFWREDQ